MRTIFFLPILVTTTFLAGCGSVYAPPQDAEASDPGFDALEAPDAPPDASSCTKPLICDPAIGWFDPCSQTVLGCPDGTSSCCLPVPGCYCAGTGGSQGDGRFVCEDGGEQSDELSCLHCRTHCADGGE